MATKQQQQPQQRQPAQQRSNSTSTTTRRLEEVQVSLVINRPGVGAKSGGVGADSDMVAIDVEDEVKVPFKSTSDAASSSLPQSKSSASKDLNNLVRRSSEVVLDNAPVATTPEAILGIETPDAKVVNRKSNRKNLFKSLFCCFSSPRRISKRQQQQQQQQQLKNGALPNNTTNNNLSLFNENYTPVASAIAAPTTPSQPQQQKQQQQQDKSEKLETQSSTTATTAKLINNDQLAQTNTINSTASNKNNNSVTNNSVNNNILINTENNNTNANNKSNNLNLVNVNLNINNNTNTNNLSSNNNANIVNTSGAAINNNTTTTTNNSYIGANLTNTFYPNDHQSFHEKFLLPPVRPSDLGKKCLIIDLDETLVHSSFKQVHNADFIVPVEIDGIVHQVYVLKRPHVDEFLKRMGEIYECVLFTASLAKYADPVADLLDKWGVFRARLFREACVYYRGNYVKDLSRLGRDLNKVLILDNSPASYIFHPDNAVACQSWFDDAHDTELRDLIPYFERLAHVDSVYTILKQQKLAAAAAAAAAGQHHHHQHQSLSHLIAAACGGSFVTSLANDSSAAEADSVVPGSSQPPSPNSVIYQMQAPPTSPPPVANIQSTPSTINNLNYLINENKMLLSIDMMMAKQQQQQISKHHK